MMNVNNYYESTNKFRLWPTAAFQKIFISRVIIIRVINENLFKSRTDEKKTKLIKLFFFV